MKLPKLLAGPIVRRVERDNVSFWVALSGNHPVTASIWLGLRKTPVADPAMKVETATPKKLGANLWIAVVTMKFTGANAILPNGRIFSYDISVGGDNLGALGLLRDRPAEKPPDDLDHVPARPALGYGPDQLPSFVTPQENLDNIVLAHGSCRRPHGPDEDAISALDKVIGDTRSDASKRPQQLFMTGDQIYADDVAMPLLPMLNALGKSLFGFDEILVQPGNTSIPVTTRPDPFGLPAGRRKTLCLEQAKITSTSASSHLLSLSEYAAMYLCAWSPEVWGKLASQTQVLPRDLPADPVAPLDELNKDEDNLKKFDEQLKNVIAFRRAVPAARRALANVATYMIFDDHEVTDDWNLTRQWRKDVLLSATGRQILRNGHVAYGFFQGWGNDPEAFSKKANLALLDKAATLFDPDGKHNAAVAQEIDELLRHKVDPQTGEDIPLSAQDVPREDDLRVKWHTTVKCPSYDVVIMDTRTLRSFEGDFTPPLLLGAHMDKQIKADKAKAFLLLISAAPVLSPPMIDRVGQPLGVAAIELKHIIKSGEDTEFSGIGSTTVDVEGWGGDEAAQEALLKKIAPFKKVLILSGDVHYGYSMVMDYWRKGNAAADRIVQLVSSGTHNWFTESVRALNRAISLASEVFGLGLQAERLGWDTSANPVNLPPGAQLSPARRGRIKYEPVLLPAHGWPANTTLNPQNLPNWRWRLNLVYDNRPDSERPSAVQIPPLSPDIDFAGDAIGAYFTVAGHHNSHAATAPNHRSLVFEPNLGVVKLSGTADALGVTHDLYSRDVTVGTRQVVNTQHVIAFVPTTDPQPEIRQ